MFCFVLFTTTGYDPKTLLEIVKFIIDFWSLSVKFSMAYFHFLATLVALHFPPRSVGGSAGEL